MKLKIKCIVKPSKKSLNKKRREILDYARDNNLVIHPSKGYEYYVESYFKYECCSCDPSRLNCPCPEAVNDVKETGCCKCRLYWRDFDTFKESHVAELE